MASVPPNRPDRIEPLALPAVEPAPAEPQTDAVPEEWPGAPDIGPLVRLPEEYPAPGPEGDPHSTNVSMPV